MSILVEQTINEIAYAGGINTNKPASFGATATFAVTPTINAGLTVTGNVAITGNETVGGTLTVTGAATVVGAATIGATGTNPIVTLGTGGPQIIAGTLAPPANPTGITAPIGSFFINLGGTGVTNRVYINTNGATGWTYLATSGA